MSNPEGTPGSTPVESPPDTPSDPQWIPLREAAPLAGVSLKTMRRRATTGKVPAEMQEGRWMVRRDALPAVSPTPIPPPVEAVQPQVGPVPEGMQLVPLDAWTTMLEQIGNLHQAGQDLAEARERAGRAEATAQFQTERRHELERKVAELEARLAGEPAPTPEPATEHLPDIDDSTVERFSREVEELRSSQESRPWWRILFGRQR